MSHRIESEQRNYFTSVQSQLSATVVEPLSSMGQTYSENAKSGVYLCLNLFYFILQRKKILTKFFIIFGI
ncbi:hypothetical protein SAMN05421544_10658 [Riemerella columbipharyngis]|uniref:Uncharacterized protein n=1 Tax=Riemerella columbipharyngis TaxID=1071918 RepID=A0A1G7BN76_9FLAO|nr:hypothetical protein SAMN05421544_10658 [Riemerella columbipharyngis]